MGKALKAGVLLLVVTTLVWLTTLWRWETTARALRGEEVLLHLVALPLAATAALLFAIWAVARLRHYAAQPSSGPAATSTANAAGLSSSQGSGSNAERQLAFAVLGSAAHSRGGADWSTFAQASAQATPTLDTELRDEHGIAVFSARTEEAAAVDVKAELEAAVVSLALRRSGPAEDLRIAPAAWRALALLRATVEALLPTLVAQCAALHELPSGMDDAGGPSGPGPIDRHRREVQVRIGVPLDWPETLQAVLSHWLSERIALLASSSSDQHGAHGAVALVAPAAVQVHPVATAEEFWQLTEQQLLRWHRDDTAGLLLALAADSLLGHEQIARLAGAGGLFSGQHVGGHIPGEAAAGLLLASDAWIGAAGGTATPVAMLHRASVARREKSADAAGRTCHATLTAVLADALAASGASPSEVLALTSDADHRGSRSAEVFEALQGSLPQLDNSTDLLRTGLMAGEVGVARLLLIAALSASKTREAGGPVVLVGLQPNHQRFAAVMRPVFSPAPAAPAGAAGAIGVA